MTAPTATRASSDRTDHRNGILAGVAAYGVWGLFPLYWPLLKPATPGEILAHRIVWSLVVCAGLLLVLRRGGWLRWARPLLADRRAALALVGSAVLISVNWLIYITAVNTGQVVEASLGYFINPLVSVLLGVVVLRERLRRWQWVAVGVGTVAVVVLAVDYGRPPWFALVLACSFGTYGLLKKIANVPALDGLAAETGLLMLPAAGYLGWLEYTGHGAFGHVPAVTSALLAGTGVTTAIPLLFFAAAARRLPLSTVGLLQYLAPILQFACGVLVFHEAMPAARWIGFALVWLALAVFSADSVRNAVRRQTGAGAPEAVGTPAC